LAKKFLTNYVLNSNGVYAIAAFAGGSKVNTGDADKENPNAGTGSAG